MYNLSTIEVLTINNQTSRCITGFTKTFTKQTQTDSKATSGSTQHKDSAKQENILHLKHRLSTKLFLNKTFLSNEGCFYLVVHLTPNDSIRCKSCEYGAPIQKQSGIDCSAVYDTCLYCYIMYLNILNVR